MQAGWDTVVRCMSLEEGRERGERIMANWLGLKPEEKAALIINLAALVGLILLG